MILNSLIALGINLVIVGILAATFFHLLNVFENKKLKKEQKEVNKIHDFLDDCLDRSCFTTDFVELSSIKEDMEDNREECTKYPDTIERYFNVRDSIKIKINNSIKIL